MGIRLLLLVQYTKLSSLSARCKGRSNVFVSYMNLYLAHQIRTSGEFIWHVQTIKQSNFVDKRRDMGSGLKSRNNQSIKNQQTFQEAGELNSAPAGIDWLVMSGRKKGLLDASSPYCAGALRKFTVGFPEND